MMEYTCDVMVAQEAHNLYVMVQFHSGDELSKKDSEESKEEVYDHGSVLMRFIDMTHAKK